MSWATELTEKIRREYPSIQSDELSDAETIAMEKIGQVYEGVYLEFTEDGISANDTLNEEFTSMFEQIYEMEINRIISTNDDEYSNELFEE